MTNWTELKRLAEEAGAIEWHADTAVANDGSESRAIYHRPKPYHVVEIIETPDSAIDNAECIHSEAVWKFIASANPKTILALIDENERLRTRLEVSYDHPYDGIYFRDATIQGLEQLIEKLWRPIEQERDELRAEVEALIKDAERYRHLKDQGHFRAMSMDMGGNHSWTGMGRHVGKGPTIDDAIDSEIARSKP